VPTRESQVLTILDRLISNVGRAMVGTAVVAPDGIVLAARLAESTRIEYLGALAATIYGITDRAVREFKSGHLDETIIKASTGLLMVVPISEHGLLVLDLEQGGNLGMARLEARAAVTALREVLSTHELLERSLGA
jgi:predicted regulator of Ras-like GTPase activity (Roadblock/LC7/MglB family)